ncbi:hypothetical protein [Rhizobium sp. LCM 4573]|nr:hypothetical protein [Rhizobium sp. LCM 4573]
MRSIVCNIVAALYFFPPRMCIRSALINDVMRGTYRAADPGKADS